MSANPTADSWLTFLGNSIMALQPFSAYHQRLARARLAQRILGSADRSGFADLAWDSLGQWVDAVTFQRDGIIWTGSLRSLITRELFVQGGFQKEQIENLLSWLKESYPLWRQRPVIINVGANIGDTCIPMALATDKVFVACEPVPQTFNLLCRNVTENRLNERIRGRQVAVSKTSDSLKMVLTDELGQCEVQGAEGKQGYPLEHYRGGTIDVPAVSLDSLVTAEGIRPDDVALVWSDTQGYESDVLQSGASLWQSGTPAWVEVWPAGLNAQGGADRFVHVCEQYFKGFIESAALRAGDGKPRPIRDLADLVASLGGTNHTDVLLLQ